MDPTSHDLEAGVIEMLPTQGNGGLTINPDGTMSVRVEISADAKWSDGRPIIGADFVRTYDVVAAQRAAIHPDVIEAFDAIVPGSVVAEEQQVSFAMKSPTLALTEVFSYLLPAHQVDVDTFLDDWTHILWSSAGPFVFDHTVDQTLFFTRNPHFREVGADGSPLPYLDRLEVTLLSSPEEAVVAFTDGEIDVVGGLERPRSDHGR